MVVIARIWLPVAIAAVGVILIVIGHGRTPAAAAGVVLLGIAVMVWMINWMFQLSVKSNRDREREEEARDFFDAHGRWPDE
jgi:uncharacterized membrane protein